MYYVIAEADGKEIIEYVEASNLFEAVDIVKRNLETIYNNVNIYAKGE